MFKPDMGIRMDYSGISTWYAVEVAYIDDSGIHGCYMFMKQDGTWHTMIHPLGLFSWENMLAIRDMDNFTIQVAK